MSRTKLSETVGVEAALFGVVLMWASTFTLFKIAWHDVDPVAFTAVRFAAMVLVSLAVLLTARNRVKVRRQDIPLIVASGLTGYFLYQMSFILGLDRTTAVASSLLVATHPIFSLLFMWMAGKEHPNRVEVAGVVVGFLGVAVFLRAWDAFASATVGDLLSLAAAAAFGAYGVINRPLVQRYPSRQMMAYGLSVGGLLIAVVGMPAVVRQDWTSIGLPAWGILVYATVLPVYVAYALWNWAIGKRGIPRTVVYGFLVPVVAGALAVAVLGEQVRLEQAVGAVMVVGGMLITRLHVRHRPFKGSVQEVLEGAAQRP
jgi:drug/metabolite transporter (DMT)-like permease